jgi:hypothetical protein
MIVEDHPGVPIPQYVRQPIPENLSVVGEE